MPAMGLTSTTGDSSSLIMNTSTDGFLLAATDHFVERNTVDLNNLVANTGDVTVRTPHASADTFHHHFIVFVNEVDSAIARGEGREFVAVFDKRDFDGF